MEQTMSGILIETYVKSVLKRLKDDPERGLRQLADTALHFSKGRFQKQFFQTIQRMLENEESGYYRLLRDILSYADTDRLFTFGMNAGYHGLTVGAERIRANEREKGVQIPWVVTFVLEPERFLRHEREYADAVRAGERLGICNWILIPEAEPIRYLSLVGQFPDSAFFLCCRADEVTSAYAERAAEYANLMTLAQYGPEAGEACGILRDAGMLYSVWYPYGNKDEDWIVSGDLFLDAQQMKPLFTVLLPEQGCSGSVRARVCDTVRTARMEQHYQTIPWELYEDGRAVDHVISDEVCTVYYDQNGRCHDLDGNSGGLWKNLFPARSPKPGCLDADSDTERNCCCG